jgi:large subunit ribosomal protein L4
MKLAVFDIEGKPTGEEVELSNLIFDIEPNDHAIAQAVTAELANRRQGTHCVKTRSMVAGGGKKPWRQKGRGVARAGTIRSPLWRHGGIIFGPTPHRYYLNINKKVKRLARKSALTYKARENRIRIITDFNWEEGKTSQARNLLKAFSVQSKDKALLLTTVYSPLVLQACRNIPTMEVNIASDVSTRQILRGDILLIQKGALSSLQEVLAR